MTERVKLSATLNLTEQQFKELINRYSKRDFHIND